ncbi:MAG: type II secretion system protein GspN [Cloacibacillus sp.]
MRGVIKKILAVVAGLLAALLLFFPWDTLASFVFAAGARVAAENGIYATAASSETSGIFSKSFTYGGLKADFPVFRVTTRELTVTPNIISSVFSATKSCSISTGKGSIIPVTRQAMEWNSGAADISVTAESIIIQNIAFTGKTSISGFVEISRATSKMTRAKVLLKVPQELDRMLNIVGMTGMLPLSRIKDGEWRIER